MGQKINPVSNRLPLTKAWKSRWFAGRDYAKRLLVDLKLRDLLEARFGRQAAVGKVEMRGTAGGQLHIIIHTAKPGIIIGRAGSGLAELRKAVDAVLETKVETAKSAKAKAGRAATRPSTETNRVKIDVVEIKTPELWGKLVGETIAGQIERRMMYRRAIRQAMERVMGAGAKGVKIVAAGRLGGVEISRTEKFTDGSVPLSTFRADIDYAAVEAQTTYGTIGLKVWIHRGPLDLDANAEPTR